MAHPVSVRMFVPKFREQYTCCCLLHTVATEQQNWALLVKSVIPRGHTRIIRQHPQSHLQQMLSSPGSECFLFRGIASVFKRLGQRLVVLP